MDSLCCSIFSSDNVSIIFLSFTRCVILLLRTSDARQLFTFPSEVTLLQWFQQRLVSPILYVLIIDPECDNFGKPVSPVVPLHSNVTHV